MMTPNSLYAAVDFILLKNIRKLKSEIPEMLFAMNQIFIFLPSFCLQF